MVTQKERDFLKYWSTAREQEAGTLQKIVKGLPVAILFTLPIILLVITVYIFLPEWYTKVAPKDPGMFFIIFIALIIAILFIAFFRMQFNFEKNDDLYKLINHKLTQETALNDAAKTP